MTKEQIIKFHIPDGIVNIKGKGDGKPQYKAEINVIEKCMETYASQQLTELEAKLKEIIHNQSKHPEGKIYELGRLLPE